MAPKWWWIGFADPSRPAGKRGVGAIVVSADDERYAIDKAAGILGRGLFSTLDGASGAVDQKYGAPPAGSAHRLLTMAESEQLAATWLNSRLATQDELRAAVLDDAAKPGDPLFKGPR